MLVETKYLGEIDIDENMIIQFGSGLPGFQNETKFVILDIPGNDMIQIMQSTLTVNLAFFVTNPHYFYKDFSFELENDITEALQIKDQKEIVILSIMTIKEPFELSTINLQAPVIINSTKKIGKQYILKDNRYPLKAKISIPNEERGK